MHPYNVQQQKEALIRYKRLKRLKDSGYTLEAIGKLEGCTRERVRQILEHGAKKETAS